MRSIEIDNDVYSFLEAKVQGFDDTPNFVLRRLLGITTAPSEEASSRPPVPIPSKQKRKRGKAPKTNLRELVRIGSLSEGQTLYMHDYQCIRISGAEAEVRGNNLEYNGKLYSMSALTRDIMKKQGYGSNSYRGPQFWYTAQGECIKDMWDEYLREFSN